MKLPYIAAVVVAAGALALAGCQTQKVRGPLGPGESEIVKLEDGSYELNGRFGPDGALIPDPVVGQPLRGQPFSFESMSSRQLTNGFTQVQLVVANQGSFALDLQYRFLWFDEDGIEIRAGTGGWRTARVAAKESVSVMGVSHEREPAAVKVFVRKLHYKK